MAAKGDEVYKIRRNRFICIKKGSEETVPKKKPTYKENDLVVTIHHAEGLDNPRRYPDVSSRYYKVVFWVHPNEEYETQCVLGKPHPVWNSQRCIELNRSLDTQFLYVEVLRYGYPGSSPDPASSSSVGLTVVGRAKIPLTRSKRKITDRQVLYRAAGDTHRVEGQIVYTLEIFRQ
ncbi:conserved hypothetical protein [Ricinus communis]|uniref:C2 domain-containing protein n=1 Tax=Ricinus communis TaxID=3988 RepID=B9SQY0_RICCO|nr:conserved hypothetical protein [Ricinus communis]